MRRTTLPFTAALAGLAALGCEARSLDDAAPTDQPSFVAIQRNQNGGNENTARRWMS